LQRAGKEDEDSREKNAINTQDFDDVAGLRKPSPLVSFFSSQAAESFWPTPSLHPQQPAGELNRRVVEPEKGF
jgi:hypothetical protein